MMSRWPQQPPPPVVGQAELVPPGPSSYIHMAMDSPSDGEEEYVLPPPLMEEGKPGSVWALAPAWAKASRLAARPGMGGRPRSTRSRSVSTKSCSGGVNEG
jgi:hypothetical protein